MSVTPSQRSPREWPLLVLALILVGIVCVPLWQWSGRGGGDEGWSKWKDPERLGRLLIGPEQIASYCCFLWAALILLSRRREVSRQRQAFRLDLLPTEEGYRILPEDARPLLRKMETSLRRRGPYILATMIRLALGKYAVSRSGPDVGEVVRTQAEVEQGRLVSSMATVQYLAWAIPAIGFLGTVRGLAQGLTMGTNRDAALNDFIDQATRHLAVAFDCTFVALTLSLVLMYFLHGVQRDEETLIIDCQQYCQEHLLLRLYDPQPESAAETAKVYE
jgi:MotA/TolQ/ExbB proton channel family